MAKSSKSWYEFKAAAAGKPARIIIEDEIGGWGVSAKNFRADFARLGKDEAVQIHIKSGGGSCFEGSEIANIIADHDGEVTVTLGSVCASIATVIACAGDKVIAAKNSLYMIHEPTVYAGGDAKELRKMAEVLDKIKKNLVGAYKKKTGKSEDELSDLIAEETWFTAEEAKEAGFVDEISGEDADDDVLDNLDLSHYANTTKLFSLQVQNAADAVMLFSGNGKRLTLAEIKNSLSSQKTKPTDSPDTQSQPENNTMTLTPEQQNALETENQKKIDAGIKAAIEAAKNRRRDVLEIVAQEKKRTGIDFSAEAEVFLNDDEKPAHAFASIILNSDKKPAIVGSGIEVVEPLDAFKGTPGFQFVNSEQFRALGEQIKRGGRRPQGGVQVMAETSGFRNVQTSTATSGSGLTSIEKLPGVVELGVRPLTLEALISGGQTGQTTVRYIQEVTYTQAITGGTAETGALPEISLTYQEIDAPVKDIGGFIKMSENLLADYVAVASFINARLPYQVDRAVEDQLLNGDGTGSNITGILNSSGVQTLAKGGNTISDLALKLQTKVRWQNMTSNAAQGGFEPTGYIIHPTDWESYQLAKDANGQYLMKGPFYGAYGVGGSTVEFYTLWGKPVAVSPITAQGTIVCGAWNMGAQKFDRQGLIIEMSNSDGSDFLSRKITLRGTRRLALAVYRPGSFVTGTGL